MNVYDSAKKRVTLGKEIGHGGEAVIYRVQGRDDVLAKLYVPPIHPEYAPKVAWMKDHAPDERHALAWPIDLLYDAKGQFAGYLMPRIRESVTLLSVANPRLRVQTLPFDRRYLHRTARNLASALASLHANGYVVGDLHESNVLVTPEALVMLIDTDSFQVEVAGECYECVVGKPEYTAPELQGKRLADVRRGPEQDSFALGVLIFQLLMEGNHPFRSQWLKEGEPPSLGEKISRGLFPHVDPPPEGVAPPVHAPGLDTLHPGLRALIRRCFVDGHTDPHLRPTAAEWRDGVEDAEAALVPCGKGHYHSNLLVACPECTTEARRAKRAKRTTRPRRREVTKGSVSQAGQISPRSQAKTAQPKQPPVQTSLTPAAMTLRQRAFFNRLIVVMILVAIAVCTCSLLDDWFSRPSFVSPTRVLPMYTPRPTWTQTLFSAPAPQPQEAISPESAGRVRQLAKAHVKNVDLVAWLPEKELFIVSALGGTYVYESQDWLRYRFFDTFASSVKALSTEGALLAAGVGSSVKLWNVVNGQEIDSYEPLERSIDAVVLSRDGRVLASAAFTDLDVWSVETSRGMYAPSPDEFVTRLALSPNGELLAVGQMDGRVLVSSVETDKMFWVPFEHTGDVQDMVFSDDGVLLATSDGELVEVWDVADRRTLNTYASREKITGLAFAPDRTLALATTGGIVILHAEGEQSPRAFTGYAKEVRSLAFSPDGKLLASADEDGDVILWGVAQD